MSVEDLAKNAGVDASLVRKAEPVRYIRRWECS
jgi:hypothetical protein